MSEDERIEVLLNGISSQSELADIHSKLLNEKRLATTEEGEKKLIEQLAINRKKLRGEFCKMFGIEDLSEESE